MTTHKKEAKAKNNATPKQNQNAITSQTKDDNVSRYLQKNPYSPLFLAFPSFLASCLLETPGERLKKLKRYQLFITSHFADCLHMFSAARKMVYGPRATMSWNA